MLASLITAAAFAGGIPAAAPAADERIPVLLVSGANNHDWQYTTPKIQELLEASGRFAVDVTEDPAKTLADAKAVAKWKAFVLNYNGPRWGEPAESNFLAAVKGGTGVTVIHAANNAFTDWPEYMLLVGDLWIMNTTGHGAYHAFDVKVTDRNHPITRDLPDLKAHPDELYHKLVTTQGVVGRRVLATAFSAKEQGGTGEDEPMAIVLEFGKGRVFHTPLGHVWPGAVDTQATFDDPALAILIARGTEWAATGAVTLRAAAPNQLTFSEQQTGFRPLFDGKSLRGWRSYKGADAPAKGWEAADGALHCTGGGGDLVTADDFADFELRFQWRVAPGANSGVMYRVGEELEYPWQTGPEYQVLDDAKHADGKQPATSAAALYALQAAEGKTLAPVGEWNDARILVRGTRLEHWLNDKKVVSIELGSPDWKARVAASKFASMPQFATLARGRICLQDHGDEVWFRSLRIRDLSAPAAGN